MTINRNVAARTGYAVLVAVAAAAIGSVLTGPVGLDRGPLLFWLGSVMLGLALAGVGALLLALRPRNAIGPVLAVGGAALVVEYGLREVAFRTGAAVPAWFGLALDPVFFPATIALTLLLFPDGRLPSRRWAPVATLAVAVVVVQIALSLARPGPLQDEVYGYEVPWRGLLPMSARAGIDRTLAALLLVGLLVLLMCVVRLVVSARRASAEMRQRLKPLALVGLIVVASLLVQWWPPLVPLGRVALVVTGCVGLPAALAVGALRYRVWDFDRVLIATIVYIGLTALVTAVYVTVVVLAGRVLGNSATPTVLPTIVATTLVAVGVVPAKARLERLTRRLVYGVRASPYEALRALPNQLADTPAVDEVLPRTAAVLAAGLGVPTARVQAMLPEGTAFTAWAGAEVPDDAALVVVPVRHLGEVVGTVAIRPSPDRPLTGVDRRLLDDLAVQAGPALRGVALTAELRARLVELADSRHRLAQAQVVERRRLERDIHDGAQQQLVSVAVELQAAQTLLAANPLAAVDALARCRDLVGRCIDDLRELARGIYPPVLAARGLTAALRARARTTAAGVVVTSTVDSRRFPPAVELAVYFCALEALQNVAKHAPGARVRIGIQADGDELCLTVADDGPGFDPAATAHGSGLIGLADRIAAVGGVVSVDAAPGRGSRITVRVPSPTPPTQ